MADLYKNRNYFGIHCQFLKLDMFCFQFSERSRLEVKVKVSRGFLSFLVKMVQTNLVTNKHGDKDIS